MQSSPKAIRRPLPLQHAIPQNPLPPSSWPRSFDSSVKPMATSVSRRFTVGKWRKKSRVAFTTRTASEGPRSAGHSIPSEEAFSLQRFPDVLKYHSEPFYDEWEHVGDEEVDSVTVKKLSRMGSGNDGPGSPLRPISPEKARMRSASGNKQAGSNLSPSKLPRIASLGKAMNSMEEALLAQEDAIARSHEEKVQMDALVARLEPKPKDDGEELKVNVGEYDYLDLYEGPDDWEVKEDAEEDKSSDTAAVINATNLLIGVGMLSVPYGLAHTGWMGVGLLLVLTAVSWFNAIGLGQCLDARIGLHSYAEIAEAAFGSRARTALCVVLYTELFSCLVVFLNFQGDSLAGLFPCLSSSQWTIFTALLVLPTCWVQDLSKLAFLSLLGLVSSFVTILALLYQGCLGPDPKLLQPSQWPHEVVDWAGMPFTAGIVVFGYGGICCLPCVRESMQNSADYGYVVAVSFTIATGASILLGMAGYAIYGDSAKDIITLNIEIPWLRNVVTLMALVISFSRFALNLNPVACGIEELLPAQPQNPNREVLHRVVVRTTIVGLATVVGLSVPFFGLVVSLVGAMFSISVVITIPAIFWLRLCGPQSSWFATCLNWIIVITGLALTVDSTTDALVQLINAFESGSKAQG